jgi:hypothetical protein
VECYHHTSLVNSADADATTTTNNTASSSAEHDFCTILLLCFFAKIVPKL